MALIAARRSLVVRRFDPPMLAGLQLWLSADRQLTMADGAVVGTWPDLSGRGNNATQATAAAKPVFKVGIIGGRPVVRFDGTDDVMVATSTFGDINYKNQAFTIAMMLTWATTAYMGFLGLKPTTAGNFGVQANQSGGDNPLLVFLRQDGATTDRVVLGTGVGGAATATAYVLVWTYDGTGTPGTTTVALRLNGVVKTLSTTTTNATWQATNNSVGLGLGDSFPNADYGELAIWNRVLSAVELRRLERAWGRRYGIAVS